MFGQVIALLNRREDYVKDILNSFCDEADTKILLSEIKEILNEITATKKNIHQRFLKEHLLSEKLEKLSEVSSSKTTKISELTEDLHLKVDRYNHYVEKINELLTGKFSGIFFKIFNIPLAGKIEV